jgi:hypothetical protein
MIAEYSPVFNFREKKFLVVFPEEFGVEEISIKNFKRPGYKQDMVEIRTLRAVHHIPARLQYEDMEIEIRGFKTMSLLGELAPEKHIKFDYVIEVVDKTNIVLEEWKFKDCFVHKYDISYHQDEEYDEDQVIATLTISSNTVKMEEC